MKSEQQNNKPNPSLSVHADTAYPPIGGVGAETSISFNDTVTPGSTQLGLGTLPGRPPELGRINWEKLINHLGPPV